MTIQIIFQGGGGGITHFSSLEVRKEHVMKSGGWLGTFWFMQFALIPNFFKNSSDMFLGGFKVA